jgi:hypothetical protein
MRKNIDNNGANKSTFPVHYFIICWIRDDDKDDDYYRVMMLEKKIQKKEEKNFPFEMRKFHFVSSICV